MSLKKKLLKKMQIVNRRIGVRLDKKTSEVDYGKRIGRHNYGPLAKPGEYDMNFIESIGSFCSFGFNTAVVQTHYMGVTTHQFLFASWRYPDFDRKLPHDKQEKIFREYIASRKTFIGNDVWTGRNVSIMAGVRIGDGAVIGTGAVVTHDIPPYAIAVGVPAKVIKYRFTPEQIEALEQIQWWNWDDDIIAERYDDFLDIDEFIRKYGVENK